MYMNLYVYIYVHTHIYTNIHTCIYIKCPEWLTFWNKNLVVIVHVVDGHM